jgi:hypothetical protein
MDREEFGLVMAGINEAGLTLPSGAEVPMVTFKSFQLQKGGVVAPTVAFAEMDVARAHMARPYQEFLHVIGKPSAMRGNTLSFAEYIGSHNSNGPSGPGKGDHGPIIALRLLSPEGGELSNELQIRGTLTASPEEAARQEFVIISVSDQLLNIAYKPPSEMPVSTSIAELV